MMRSQGLLDGQGVVLPKDEAKPAEAGEDDNMWVDQPMLHDPLHPPSRDLDLVPEDAPSEIGSAAFSSVASAMQDFVELQRPGERKRRLWAEATSRRAESRSLPILPRLQASRISSGGMHLLE